MDETLARKLLAENGFKIYGAPLNGDNTRNWSAKAKVILLIAVTTITFELVWSGGEANFIGTREDGASKTVSGTLEEMALLAVETKFRAERS